MTNDGDEAIDDATNNIATDDAESSTQTTIERSEVEAVSGDGEGNDVQDHKPDGTVPFARSIFLSGFIMRFAAGPVGLGRNGID